MTEKLKWSPVGLHQVEWFLIGQDRKILSLFRVRAQARLTDLLEVLQSGPDGRAGYSRFECKIHIVSDMPELQARLESQGIPSGLMGRFLLALGDETAPLARLLRDDPSLQSISDSLTGVFSGSGSTQRDLELAEDLMVETTRTAMLNVLTRISSFNSWLRRLKHVWANQVMRVKGRLEVLEDTLSSVQPENLPQVERSLELTSAAIRSLGSYDSHLKSLSYLTGEQILPRVDLLVDSVTKASQMYCESPRFKAVPLVRRFEERAVFKSVGNLHEDALAHAVFLLLENAYAASLGTESPHILLDADFGASIVPVGVLPSAQVFHIRVGDCGRGEVLDPISFESVSAHAPPSGGGLGLGVPTILKILRAYEGTLWCRKHEEGGAEFLIEVPISS